MRQCKMKYMFRQIMEDMQLCVLSIIVIIVAFIFVNLVFAQYFDTTYQVMCVKKLLGNTDSVIQLEFQNHNMEEMELKKINNFVNDLKELPGLQASGKYSMYTMVFTELQHEQETETPIIIMNKEILSLIENFPCDDWKLENCEEIPILVGEKYRQELTIGQVISSPFVRESFRVVGFMNENYQWLADSLFFSENNITKLDDKMIVISDEGFSPTEDFVLSYINNIYVKAYSNTEEVLKQLDKLSDKYEVILKCHTITDLIQEYQKENREIRLVISIITLIISVVALLSAWMTNIINFMYRKREYAIMICVGFSVRSLIFMLFLENSMKIILGYIGAHFVVNLLHTNLQEMDLARETFIQERVLEISIIYGVILLITSLLFLGYMLKRKSVQNLLGGNYYD